MYKAIIFDFDGVIHNTFDLHLQRIPQFSGVSLTSQTFRNAQDGNVFKSMPEKYKQIDWKKYNDFINPDYAKLKIKKEIRDLIIKFSIDYDLYIISSGGTKNILSYLQNNGLENLFKEVLGMEFNKSKVFKFNYIFNKHNLSKEQCIFITDTLGDVLEAHNVDLKTIAVDFGYHSKARLEKGKPWKIISSIGELPKVLS